MTEAIAPLRARVALQSPARVEDDIGGAAIGWTDEGEAWALVEARGAAQRSDYDVAPSVAGYRLTLRARSDVRAGWRAIWGARVLRVTGVEDEGGARISVLCEEETL